MASVLDDIVDAINADKIVSPLPLVTLGGLQYRLAGTAIDEHYRQMGFVAAEQELRAALIAAYGDDTGKEDSFAGYYPFTALQSSHATRATAIQGDQGVTQVVLQPQHPLDHEAGIMTPVFMGRNRLGLRGGVVYRVEGVAWRKQGDTVAQLYGVSVHGSHGVGIHTTHYLTRAVGLLHAELSERTDLNWDLFYNRSDIGYQAA